MTEPRTTTTARLVGVSEAAAQLGVSRPTIYKLMEDGALSSVHIRSKRMIHAESLEALITKGTDES